MICIGDPNRFRIFIWESISINVAIGQGKPISISITIGWGKPIAMIWIGEPNRFWISIWQPKSVANLNRVIYLMLMANWMENQPLLQWTSCAVQPPPNIYGIQSVKVRFSEENRIVQVIKYVADFNNYYNWSRQADCNDLDRRTQPILNIHLAADINNRCNRLRQTDSNTHYNRSRQADCDDLQEANRLGIFNWQLISITVAIGWGKPIPISFKIGRDKPIVVIQIGPANLFGIYNRLN